MYKLLKSSQYLASKRWKRLSDNELQSLLTDDLAFLQSLSKSRAFRESN